MNIFIEELQIFCKRNWWIFLLLIIALIIIYITGKGSLIEVFILFFINFLGSLLIMVMQHNYTNGNNKIGSTYYVVATLIFTSIGLYGLLYLGQSQYMLWQIVYWLAAIKTFIFYNFNKNIKILSIQTFILLNIILLIIFLNKFEYQIYSILQVIGFSFVTTGLVSIKDSIRYWLNVIGIFFITSGSLLGVYVSYNIGNIDGIALGYFLLTLTVFIYYLKLIKKYI